MFYIKETDNAKTKWLKRTMFEKSINGTQLARKIGVSRQSVSCWCSEKVPFSKTHFLAMCYAFELYDIEDAEKIWKALEES